MCLEKNIDSFFTPTGEKEEEERERRWNWKMGVRVGWECFHTAVAIGIENKPEFICTQRVRYDVSKRTSSSTSTTSACVSISSSSSYS